MWLRNKEVKSAAVSALPYPRPAQVIHGGANWPGIIFTGFIVLVLAAILLWHFAIHLAAVAGSDEPERDVVYFVLFVIIGVPLLLFVAYGISAIIDKFFRAKIELTRVSREYDLQRERIRLLAAQSSATGPRSLDAEHNMARLALAVLQQAYTLDRPYRPNEKRPWKRDNAFAIAQEFDIEGITQIRAGRLEDWLIDNGLIVDDQINPQYPALEDARRLIDARYSPPVVVNADRLPYRETTSII